MNNLILPVNSFADERGILSTIESGRTVPFDIKRVYFLAKLKSDEPRGFHAHKELNQFAICLSGSCRFIMDDGKEKKEFILNNSNKGILIEKLVWHEMHDFSDDCVLLVLASDHYLESDYIRNYEDFKKAVK